MVHRYGVPIVAKIVWDLRVIRTPGPELTLQLMRCRERLYFGGQNSLFILYHREVNINYDLMLIVCPL